MTSVDYIVIGVFTLAIAAAGMSFGKANTSMKSFFAAGGAVPWPINGLSLFMSFFSAGTFVVWGSIAYEFGWVAVTIQWAICLAGLLVGLFIAPKWREAQVLTVAEFIRHRLGERVQQLYTYLFLMMSLVATGAFLYPVAVIVNVATGFEITLVTLLLGSLIILYTATGGLWAVVVTDVLQFVILTAAVLIVVPLALENAGGISSFIVNTPNDFFDLVNGEYTIGFIIAFMFYNLIFVGGNWAYVQRYTTVKDRQSARKVGYLFSALYIVSPVIWMLPPMLYRTIDPALAGLENEAAYLLMVKKVLPTGMLGLMLGGIVFATASSVNTTLNLAAAVLTNDIYKKFQPNASDRKLLLVGRISTVIFGLGTIGVALMVPIAGGIVEVVLSVGALVGAPLFAPPIWALFSKRLTGKAVAFTTLASLIVNLIFKFLTPVIFSFSLNRAAEMIVGVSGPVLILLVYEASAFLKGTISQRYTEYICRKKEEKNMADKLKESLDEESEEQNIYGLKVIAVSLAFTGVLMFSLSFIAENAKILVGIMGAIIVTVSLFIWKYANKEWRSADQNIYRG